MHTCFLSDLRLMVTVLVCSPLVCAAFWPKAIFNTTGTNEHSVDHQAMTEAAFYRVYDSFVANHSQLFSVPPPIARLNFNFEAALKEITNANRLVDAAEATEPSEHFDNERIFEGRERLHSLLDRTLSEITGDAPDFHQARALLGRLLHTLQDFYSHTNWVELNQTGFDRSFLIENQTAIAVDVASPSEITCVNCSACKCVETDADTGKCLAYDRCEVGSIWRNCSNNVVTTKLTSGFYAISDYFAAIIDDERFIGANESKPFGKCSHGGVVNERVWEGTQEAAATGGINKDSIDPAWSPHWQLHQIAARLAEDATVDMIDYVRRRLRNDVLLGQLLGVFGGFLSLVVDQQAMQTDEKFRRDVKKTLYSLLRETRELNYLYAMTQYANNGDAQVRQTASAREFGVWIRSLGGVTVRAQAAALPTTNARRFLGAIRAASRRTPAQETMYLFSLSPPKDTEGFDYVRSELAERGQRLIPTYAQSAPRKLVQRRDVLGNEGVPSSDINTTIAKRDSASLAIDIFIQSVEQIDQRVTIAFDIDVFIKQFTMVFRLSIDDENPSRSLTSVKFVDPEGSQVSYRILHDDSVYKTIQVSNPVPGSWLCIVECSTNSTCFDAQIYGRSQWLLDYTFVVMGHPRPGVYEILSSHPGLQPLTASKLLPGALVGLEVNTRGLSELLSRDANFEGNVSLVSASNVTHVLRSYAVQELHPLATYYVSNVVLPSQPFKLLLHGRVLVADRRTEFYRLSQQVFTPQNASSFSANKRTPSALPYSSSDDGWPFWVWTSEQTMAVGSGACLVAAVFFLALLWFVIIPTRKRCLFERKNRKNQTMVA